MIQSVVFSASARIPYTRSGGEGCGKAGHRDALPTGPGGFDGHSEAGHGDALPTGLASFDAYGEAGHRDAGHRNADTTVAQ
jgi:hypothetical protein